MYRTRQLFAHGLLVLLIWGCGPSDIPREISLQNGVKVITKQNPKTRVVTVLLMVNAGSLHETQETQGISRLVEHALFRSSKNFQDIKREIDIYGGQYRSGTYADFVYYSMTIDREYIDHSLAILSDVVQNSEFSESLLQEAKQELEKKIKSEESNLRYQLLKIFLRQLFHNHPYRFFHLGDSERYRLFQVQDVCEYYGNLYIPKNITIVIVGDFRRARVIRFLQRSIGSFSRIAKKSYTWNQESDLDQPIEVIKRHTLHEQIALVSVGWKAPSIRDQETYGMDVLVAAIGMGESSRLNEHMKDQRGSVYSVWAEYNTPREPGYCIVTAVCDPSVVDDVKKRMLKEIDILRTDSITPEELKKGIRYIKTQEEYSHQETMGTAYYLGYCSTVQDFKFYQTYLRNIEQVTIQDIQDVIIKYLKPSNYTSVILLPAKNTKGEAR